MSNKNTLRDFCIIGLGNFGAEVARILIEEKQNITVIDNDDEVIESMKQEFCNSVKLDATKIHELEEIGIQQYEMVIVAVDNIETSITICSNLKELNVLKIFAKAKNKIHQRILKSMGISQTIIPQTEIAQKVAYQSIFGMNLGIFKSPAFKLNDFFLTVLTIYNRSIWDKKIMDIKEINNSFATLVSIKRMNGEIVSPVSGKTFIRKGDQILLIINKNSTNKLKNFLSIKN